MQSIIFADCSCIVISAEGSTNRTGTHTYMTIALQLLKKEGDSNKHIAAIVQNPFNEQAFKLGDQDADTYMTIAL